jgi:hypothetical protein
MVKASVALVVGMSITLGLSGAAIATAGTERQAQLPQAHCLHLPGHAPAHARRSSAHQARRRTAPRGSVVVSVPRAVFIRDVGGCVTVTTNTGERPQPADIFYDLRHGHAKIASAAVRAWILDDASGRSRDRL